MRRLYHYTFRLFASLKLTLVIFIGLGIALFTGMFWDQTKPLATHLQNIKAPLVRDAFLFLELHDVYHSWWFGILVLLLALNLIGCSIARLPKIWVDARNPHLLLDNYLLRKASQKAVLIVNQVSTSIFSAKEKRWQEGDTIYIFFERHKYARCGVYIIHTALLFIMFGSIAATQLGVDGMMLIPEGQFSQIVQAKGVGGKTYSHRLNFVIQCSDFRLKTYADGSPMAYESDLAIFSPDNLETPVVSKTIRVNDPLEYQGYTFYQASYQSLDGEKLVNLKIAPRGGKSRTVQVKPGEPVAFDKNSLKVTELFEDYAGLGSAVQIELNGSEFVVFRKQPKFDAEVRRGEQEIIFAGFDEPYATGISVGKVPGAYFVFAGFILMFFGLAMAFGMNQRRYYAKVTQLENGEFELTLAGVCNRYPQAFRQEFEKIVSQHQSI
ncbi:MAG: cytochrome c biogenesis protein ResB [Myxococcota bacterium]